MWATRRVVHRAAYPSACLCGGSEQWEVVRRLYSWGKIGINKGKGYRLLKW
jgi:hypothetical protein